MQQFAVVVREIRTLLASFKVVALVIPYHLHLLFGGLGVLFLEKILYRTISYNNWDTLDTIFVDIPLHLIVYYGFYVGLWLTLISKNVKYLPYGLWGFAFVALYPFEHISLGQLVQAILYAVAGYGLFRYSATSHDANNASSFKV
ncbi:hypothetical protein D7Z26_19925 [Cohnella endophytica]|uniref:Uncharacterized protein n=1 Tax=Cohnella endophytica TaxID=2419778 RepID=A0A494XK25_9BACL|nr:hypothetical protein [Cohnella endophytica]RKP50082.1 hypothetical protein D7Z26_19925 [Cohnella endophytica]